MSEIYEAFMHGPMMYTDAIRAVCKDQACTYDEAKRIVDEWIDCDERSSPA